MKSAVASSGVDDVEAAELGQTLVNVETAGPGLTDIHADD